MANAMFVAGITLIGVAAAGALIAGVIFTLSGKRLRARLEREFGKKRH